MRTSRARPELDFGGKRNPDARASRLSDESSPGWTSCGRSRHRRARSSGSPLRFGLPRCAEFADYWDGQWLALPSATIASTWSSLIPWRSAISLRYCERSNSILPLRFSSCFARRSGPDTSGGASGLDVESAGSRTAAVARASALRVSVKIARRVSSASSRVGIAEAEASFPAAASLASTASGSGGGPWTREWSTFGGGGRLSITAAATRPSTTMASAILGPSPVRSAPPDLGGKALEQPFLDQPADEVQLARIVDGVGDLADGEAGPFEHEADGR